MSTDGPETQLQTRPAATPPSNALLPTRLAAQAVIAAVRLYQLTLSPLVGGHCRYRPTCSQYFIEAVRKRGVLRGVLKGTWRILRCHPWAKGGYDPVDPPGDGR